MSERTYTRELLKVSFNDTIEELKATDLAISQARDLTQAGRLAEAERLYQQALTPLLKMFGANSLKVCSCMLDLADVYYGQQKYFDSITMLQQVLKVNEQEEILQAEEVIMTKYRHAKALDRAGYTKEACNAYLEVLELAEQCYGREASLTKAIVECVTALMKRDPSLGGVESVSCKVSQFDTSKRIVNTKGRITGNNTGSNASSNSTHTSMRPPTSTFNSLQRASSPNSTHGALRSLQSSSGLLSEGPVAKAPFKLKNWGIMVAAACVLAIGLFPGMLLNKSQEDPSKEGQEWPSRATAAPRVPMDGSLEYPVVFSTLDNIKKVDSTSDGKAVLIFRSSVTPVSVTRTGPDIHFAAKGLDVTMRKTEEGLVDSAGLRLFSSNSPEMKVANAMRNTANALNEFYQAYGRYPSNQGELQNIPGAASVNPMTSRTSFPRFMSIIENSNTSKMTLSDYNQANTFVSTLFDSNSSTGEAGSVELYSSGQGLYIRGFDRNGNLLPSTSKGRCFMITLSKGRSQG